MMAQGEPPDEFTVLLRIVEVIGDSLKDARVRQQDHRMHADLLNVINVIESGGAPGSIFGSVDIGSQETVMGDHYTTGQAGAVGPFSFAANNTFNQAWSQHSAEVDLGTLAIQLADVRVEMRRFAQSPEEDLALAAVGQARIVAVSA